MPFDMTLLKNEITHLLLRQVSDTTQTDLFGPGEHTMLYSDLGLSGPPTTHKGQFKVPHHHNIYELFGLYYYLLESGDLKMLDSTLAYMDGRQGTVWDHIETGLTIAVKGIDDRGCQRSRPMWVTGWMNSPRSARTGMPKARCWPRKCALS